MSNIEDFNFEKHMKARLEEALNSIEMSDTTKEYIRGKVPIVPNHNHDVSTFTVESADHLLCARIHFLIFNQSVASEPIDELIGMIQYMNELIEKDK